MKLLATCLVSAGVLLGRCSGECEEKSWCKTAPSTKPLDDGSENPRCKRWVDDCPCTCAGAVLQVEEDRRLEQQKEAEQAAIEATWTHHSGGGTKYLLYDVKYGEGFNLQKEIFVRAVTAVDLLNEGREPDDAEWTLVLPPWCRLAHWNIAGGRGRPQPRLPWSAFFDLEAMQSGNAKIIEYDDYSEINGHNVDLSLFAEMESPPNGRGWLPKDVRVPSKEIDCADAANLGNNPKDHWKPLNETHVRSGYSGSCNDIVVKDVKCYRGGPQMVGAVPTLIGQQTPAVPRSVLMRRFDRYSGPHDARYHAGRKLLVPSPEVIKSGEAYIAEHLPRPYLAAHVRRGDFPNYARTKTTPSLEIAAATLRRVAEELGAKAVFVCTDGTPAEKETLKENLLPLEVNFLEEDLGHPGLNAITEQWIAARANRFIGTAQSRYSLQIQEERDLMGVPEELTWRNFHKDTPEELVEKKNWFAATFHADPARTAKWGKFWLEGSDKSDL